MFPGKSAKEDIGEWEYNLISLKAKRTMNKKGQNQKRLEQLAQQMFNRGREDIEMEMKRKLKEIRERLSANGFLKTGESVTKAIELHTERIQRFLDLRLDIYREVFLDNQPIKTEADINSIMRNLERIAQPQASVILSDCDHTIVLPRSVNHFKRSMEKNVEIILSNIKRDLKIEKGKQILLGKKEAEKIKPKADYVRVIKTDPEIKNFEGLLESIDNDKLKSILLRDFGHAYCCLRKKLWKPCVVLCGGILEGVFNIKFGMEKVKKGGKSVEMRLEDMIDEAKNLGILPKKHEADLAHAVRSFRNYVHVKREIKDNHSIDDTDAHISINVVKKVFRMIKKFKEEQIKVQK